MSSAHWSRTRRSSRQRPRRRRPSGFARAEFADFEVGLLHGQMTSAREVRGDGALRGRPDRRARGDERDRGGDRRRERDRDADRGRGALRTLPAPSAPRPGRAGRARVALHPLRRSGVRGGAHGGWRRSPRARTASSSPRWTWRCAARARCSAPASTVCRGSGSRSFPSDAGLLAAARSELIALLRRHGDLRDPALGPLLDAAAERFGDERPMRRMRVVGGRLGGRRLASPPPLSGAAADGGPRPRGAVRDPRGRRGPERARPLLRHRGARDRGALARRRPAVLVDTRSPWRGATSRARAGQPLRGRPLRRAPLSALAEQRFGLIFCDPPYRLADRLEPELSQHLPPRLARRARLAIECAARRPLELEAPG